VLEDRVLARCPSCRQTFPTGRTGQQDCPHCKRPLIVPEAAPAAQPSEPPPAPAPPPAFEAPQPTPSAQPGTPWERRRELGLFAAWSQTLWMALFEPGKLFAATRLDRGSDQLGFAILTGSVFLFIGQIFERLLLPGQREQALKMIEQLKDRGVQLPPTLQKWMLAGNDNSLLATIGIALLAPVFVFLFTYLNAGITHASAMLIGQAKRGFAASFAAAAYATAPIVLLVIPGCGQFVAPLWAVVLTGVGLKITHGISSERAAASIIAPYIFLCCGCLAVSVAASSVLMSARP
jgi:hypothetical protein